jgi:hypothetical protein
VRVEDTTTDRELKGAFSEVVLVEPTSRSFPIKRFDGQAGEKSGEEERSSLTPYQGHSAFGGAFSPSGS